MAATEETRMKHGRKHCAGLNVKGEPCESPFVGKEGFCNAHGPGGQERMKRLAQKGGIKSRQPSGLDPNELGPLETHENAQAWLETLGRAVACGRLSDRQAQAAIRAVGEWVRTAGERATSEVLIELRDEIDRVKAEIASTSIKAV